MRHRPMIFILAIALLAAMILTGCTDPQNTVPSTPSLNEDTQPTSTPTKLTVDWEMQAYVCYPTGTTTDFFTIQVGGNILEEESATYLQLNIDLPETFRFRPTATSDVKGELCIGGGPGQYIAKSVYQNQGTDSPAECIWAIDTEKEYFIAYWGEEFGQFLVAAADAKANYYDVLRHFRDFIYTHCDNDPAITTWDLDWTLYGMWIGEDGQVTEEFEFTLTGLVVYHPNLANHSLADIEIRWPEGYRFYSPLEMIGVGVNEKYPEGLCIDGSIAADDRNTQKIIIGDYGLAPEQGLFWLHWEVPDGSYEIPGYLIASADPNTSREDIESFFAYMMAGEGFQHQTIDWNLHGVWVSSDGTVQTGQEGVDFSLSGTLPTEYDFYSTVEMKLNFIWPDNFTYPNEGVQTYTGGANPADKHENQSIYQGGKYVYSPEIHESIFLSYTICPEEGFIVIHVGDRYLVASTDPNADPAEIFAFYKTYVHVSQ